MFEKEQSERARYRVSVNGMTILETFDPRKAVATIQEHAERGLEATLTRLSGDRATNQCPSIYTIGAMPSTLATPANG